MSHFTDFFRQIYSGKTVGRILLNWEIEKSCKDISGNIIDLGGGQASYYRYLPKDAKVIRTNHVQLGDTEVIVDLDESLPFEANSVDTLLLFNVLYIIKDRKTLLIELKRVLKDSGRIFISMPFIYNEMQEPHDYGRLTYEGLETELHAAGFKNIRIQRLGERFSAAGNLLHSFFIFNTVRLVVYGACLGLDKLIPASLKKSHPTPIEYFCVVTK